MKKYSLSALLIVFIVISAILGGAVKIILWRLEAREPKIVNGYMLHPFCDPPVCPACGYAGSESGYSSREVGAKIQFANNPPRLTCTCNKCGLVWDMRPRLDVTPPTPEKP